MPVGNGKLWKPPKLYVYGTDLIFVTPEYIFEYISWKYNNIFQKESAPESS